MQNAAASIGLTVLDRTSALLLATSKAIKDPNDGNAVAAVGELTAGPSLRVMLGRMMSDIDGRVILREQPRITNETLYEATKMADGTLGKAYANYMEKNGFMPEGRASVQFIENSYEAYTMQRYREVHDFLHVVTGCDRTVMGELALKAFEFSQTGLPLGALALVGGAPHLSFAQQKILWTVYVPWAAKNSPGSESDAEFFLNIKWEDHLAKPLEIVRKDVARWQVIPN